MLKVKPSSRYGAPPLTTRRDPRFSERQSEKHSMIDRESINLRKDIDKQDLRRDDHRIDEINKIRDFEYYQNPRFRQNNYEDYDHKYQSEHYQPYMKEFNDDPRREYDDYYSKKPQKFWKEQEPQENKPSAVKYILGLTLFLSIAIFAWLLYRWSVSSDNESKEPIMVPSNGIFKVRPETPGGVNIPHQDMLVYGHISNKDNTPPERLLPPPEQPLLTQDVESIKEENLKVDNKNSLDESIQNMPPIQAPISPIKNYNQQTLSINNTNSIIKYIAVLSSFPTRAQAELDLSRLKKQYGYKNIEISKSNDGKLYRVVFKTQFDSLEEAEDMCSGKRGCKAIRSN